MKGKVLFVPLLLIMAIIAISGPISNVVDGQRGGPGMGDDVGPVGPGPMGEQETDGSETEMGYRFRYGTDTPVTSVEGGEDRDGLSINYQGVAFRNGTTEKRIELSDREWEIEESTSENGLTIDYSAMCKWEEEGSKTEVGSLIRIKFQYKSGAEGESVDHSISIDQLPGRGTLTIEMKSGSSESDQGCCWMRQQEQGATQGHRFLYSSDEGQRISMMSINGTVALGTENGTLEEDITIEEQLTNETITLKVGSQISEGTTSFSISGSLSIMEGFTDFIGEGAEEAAGFVMEHIYSFLLGTVVIIISAAIGLVLLSRKKVETSGRDLDLSRNRYYKGDQ